MRPTWKKVYHPNGLREVWRDGRRPEIESFWTMPLPNGFFDVLNRCRDDTYVKAMEAALEGSPNFQSYRRMVLSEPLKPE